MAGAVHQSFVKYFFHASMAHAVVRNIKLVYKFLAIRYFRCNSRGMTTINWTLLARILREISVVFNEFD